MLSEPTAPCIGRCPSLSMSFMSSLPVLAKPGRACTESFAAILATSHSTNCRAQEQMPVNPDYALIGTRIPTARALHM